VSINFTQVKVVVARRATTTLKCTIEFNSKFVLDNPQLGLLRLAPPTQILHHRLIAKIKAQKPYDFLGLVVPTLPLLRRCKMSAKGLPFVVILGFKK